MDVHAAAEAASLVGARDPALAVSAGGAGPVSAQWMLPKALWLLRNEPANFDAAAAICESQDRLNLHLTPAAGSHRSTTPRFVGTTGQMPAAVRGR